MTISRRELATCKPFFQKIPGPISEEAYAAYKKDNPDFPFSLIYMRGIRTRLVKVGALKGTDDELFKIGAENKKKRIIYHEAAVIATRKRQIENINRAMTEHLR